MTKRHITLIGGAPLTGKSTLAARLAKEQVVPWVSTDDIRKWMEALVKKEDYPGLFYSHGMDAPAFYKKYTTAKEVFEREIKQGEDVQIGVTALIDNFWWWDDFIIEGIAITPEYVHRLQQDKPDTDIDPLFLVDTDNEHIKKRLDIRGLWSETGSYPESLKEIELEWTILYNEYFERKIKEYNYKVY